MARLHAAKQLLTANTDETVLIADVARAYGLSRQYFTKAFKAATGVTPHRWLPRYRVEAATQLLGTTSLPIAKDRDRVRLCRSKPFLPAYSRSWQGAARETGASKARGAATGSACESYGALSSRSPLATDRTKLRHVCARCPRPFQVMSCRGDAVISVDPSCRRTS